MNPLVINQYNERFESFLQDIVVNTAIPAKRIHNAVHYCLFPGGKRIRPLLVYLAGELIGVQLDILDIIASALELTHCYSLIHDDLPAMDDDDLRRGKPSCHKAYDEATAILVGDGLQALAIEVLVTKLPPYLEAPEVVRITQLLVQASGVSGMVSGQSLDLSELSRASVSEGELRNIHLLKTGRLIQACFEMVLATQPSLDKTTAHTLIAYAMHIGLVFQMQDDYLDHYASADTLGKGRSSDTANHKTTFATLLTKQQLEEHIAHHYQIALESLTIFGEKAASLVELTRKLESRSNVTVTV